MRRQYKSNKSIKISIYINKKQKILFEKKIKEQMPQKLNSKEEINPMQNKLKINNNSFKNSTVIFIACKNKLTRSRRQLSVLNSKYL